MINKSKDLLIYVSVSHSVSLSFSLLLLRISFSVPCIYTIGIKLSIF